jgi:hypothetical protein
MPVFYTVRYYIYFHPERKELYFMRNVAIFISVSRKRFSFSFFTPGRRTRRTSFEVYYVHTVSLYIFVYVF